jgi:hypothetical protein
VRAKSETLRRLRLGDLQKVIRWRYGPVLPDDDAGREDLHELLLPVSLGQGDWRKMKNAIEIWAPWMNAGEALEFINRVNRTPDYLRKPTASVLGEKLRLLNHERETLGIRTIKPVDLTDEQLLEQRKAKKRARDERRRRKAGKKPRDAYLANALTRLKPWEAEGVSRRTWFRKRGTGQRSIKLTNSCRSLVPTNTWRVKKEATDKEVEQRKHRTVSTKIVRSLAS